MKLKLIFSLTVAVLGVNFTASSQTPKATAGSASKQDIDAGKMLISKSDCVACHSVDKKLVGPSYLDVAKKYPLTDANVNLLAAKVIKGGSGVWGQIPMVPHATLSSEDSKKMVKYVLSLK